MGRPEDQDEDQGRRLAAPMCQCAFSLSRAKCLMQISSCSSCASQHSVVPRGLEIAFRSSEPGF